MEPTRFRLPILVAAAFALLPLGEAAACSCAPRHVPSAAEMRQLAPVIFTGLARASRMVGAREIETTFEVTEAFQGTAVGQRLIVRHDAPKPGSCGVGFTVGETQTLAAHPAEAKNVFTTSLCSVWMFAAEDGEKLIEGLRRRP